MGIKRNDSLISRIIASLRSGKHERDAEDGQELATLRNELLPHLLKFSYTISLIFSVVHYVRGDIVLSLGCFAAGVACFALTFLPRTRTGILLTRQGIVLSAFFLFILLTLRTGGTSSPMMLWLMLCPVLAIVTGGKRFGLIWSVISSLGILGVYLLDILGVYYPPIPNHLKLIYLISSVSLMLFIISIMFRFESLSIKLIIKLKVAIKTINELAIRDELTGSYGRRELLRLLEIEVQRSRRNGVPLTLALMDVDFFKKINDTHGHDVGDRVLKALSKVIEDNKRQIDYFGRYGGEEFLLLMVDADLNAARIIADRLHHKVKEHSFHSRDLPSITLSIGLCQFEESMNINEFIAFADQAMYHAKATGRNRIISMDQLGNDRDNQQDNQRSYTRFEDLANQSSTVIWMSDRSSSIIFLNKKWSDITGQSAEEALGSGWVEMVHPEDRESLLSTFSQSTEAEQVFMAEYRLKSRTGEYRWVSATASPRIDNEGAYLGYIGGLVDIQEAKAIEEALYVSNERFEAAIEAVEGSMWTTDAQGNMVSKQPQWEKLTGQIFEQYKGYGWTKPIHPDDLDNYLAATARSIESGVPLDVEQRLLNKNGDFRRYLVKASPVRNPDGTIREWVGIHIDITDTRANEEQVAHLATHDRLTGLPNRLLLQDRLESLTLQREDENHAVLSMDINRFKVINDTLGHSTGDQLLVKVANLLASNLKSGDFVARIGGDEFVVVLLGVDCESDVALMAKYFLDLLAEPASVGETELILNASIGVAMFPQDGTDGETLLRHADNAMYQAKTVGGNAIKFYDENSNVRFKERLTMEQDLRRALRNNELYLDYQPKVDLLSHEIKGMEALVRWRHPTRGLISPLDFIPLAEEIGLIGPIGEWVLHTAAEQLHQWQAAGVADLKMSVNISVHQMKLVSFLPRLREWVAKEAINTALFELEITESALMENIKFYKSILEEIRSLGFTLAIDDFGTGYSSLSYLKSLPIETLKIDRSFITDLIENANDAAIVSATISMAQKMKLAIIAEGVETQEQAAFLENNGCSLMQGYYFSRPLASGDALGFIQQFNNAD